MSQDHHHQNPWTFLEKFDHQLDANNKLSLEIDTKELVVRGERGSSERTSIYSITLGKKYRAAADGKVVFLPHLPVQIKRQNGKVTVEIHQKELIKLLDQTVEYLTNREQLAYDEEIDEKQNEETKRDRVAPQRPGLKELAKREKARRSQESGVSSRESAPSAQPKAEEPQ